MFPRKTVTTLSLFVIALSVTTSLTAKPNILFIAIDDLRPTLGCYGDQHAVTPNIDSLAAKGITFTRAYCQQAVCSPSRTSVMTGLRPDSTRVWDLQTVFRDTIPDVVTMTQHFRSHGYHTESIGKIMHKPHMQDDENSWSVPSRRGRGSHWHTSENIALRNRLLAEADERGLTGKDRYYTTLSSPTDDADVADSDHADGHVAEMALESLRSLAEEDQPFFLAVGFVKPHLPFSAPRRYWDLYEADKLPRSSTSDFPEGSPEHAHTFWGELRHYYGMPEKGPVSDTDAQRLVHGYYACVSFTDALVGRLLEQLRTLGIEEETTIVLWSDHGWKLGDYGAWCKHTAFEIDARVPLIVHVPKSTTGQKCSALVELVDIYPTLCKLADLPLPTHLEGNSLVPLLENPQQSGKGYALSQWPGKRKNVMGYSIRTPDWRYTEWRKQHKRRTDEVIARELYDHRKGVLEETKNEAEQEANRSVTEELTAELAERFGFGMHQRHGSSK